MPAERPNPHNTPQPHRRCVFGRRTPAERAHPNQGIRSAPTHTLSSPGTRPTLRGSKRHGRKRSGDPAHAYLRNLTVDLIKIDGSFIRDIADDPPSRAIVRAIVDIAESLSLATIAEMVEDERTLEEARRLGIHYVQGFAVSRPEPLETCGCLRPVRNAVND